jgi:hypothetical protein
MPRYRLEGRDSNGEKVFETLDGRSVADARAELERRGWRDIVLVSDDASTGRVLRPSVEPPADVLTPEESFESHKPRTPLRMYLFNLGIAYRKTALWLVGFAGWFAWRRTNGAPWSFTDFALISVVALPGLFMSWASLLGPAGKYQRYLRAIADGRGEEALASLKALEKTLEPMTLGLAKARCLAMMGRKEEAYRLVEELRPSDPERLFPFLTQASVVYSAGHDHDREIQLGLEAIEVAPDKEMQYLSVSTPIVLWQRDAAKAREYLDRSANAMLPEWAGHFRPLTEGMVAFEEGRAEEARALLDAARKSLLPHLGLNPAMEGSLTLIDLYDALSSVALGDRVRAERAAKRARPKLSAHRQEELLRRLDEAGLG